MFETIKPYYEAELKYRAETIRADIAGRRRVRGLRARRRRHHDDVG